jgi:hypothetical protein
MTSRAAASAAAVGVPRRIRPRVRLVTTVALFVMLVIAAAIVVLTGPIANQVGTPLAAHNKTYGALATVIVCERPPTHPSGTAGDRAGPSAITGFAARRAGRGALRSDWRQG